MLWLLFLALGGAPKLGTPAAVRKPDGAWKCSAMCLTGGNDDGGYCRVPLISTKPTEAACIQDLTEQCTKTKPPPGGCRWGNNPPPASK